MSEATEGTGRLGRGWQRVLAALVAINLATWSAGLMALHLFDLDREEYALNYHHHRVLDRFADPAAVHLAEAWAWGDAQWFMYIAHEGYPPENRFVLDKSGCQQKPKRIASCQNYAAWAFFPLWPATVWAVGRLLGDPYAGGLLAAAALGLLAGVLLYGHLERRHGRSVALWSVLLWQAFPFSLFLRVPFTESLFACLSVLAFIALERHAWVPLGVVIGLLAVTRPNGAMVIAVPAVYLLVQSVRARHPVARATEVAWLLLAGFPLAGWLAFNRSQTSNPLFFTWVQRAWGHARNPWSNLAHNLRDALHLHELEWHGFLTSRVDTLAMLLGLVLLAIGVRRLEAPATVFAATVLLVPLLATRHYSGRYLVTAWPLFVTLAGILDGPRARRLRPALLAAFLLGQMVLATRLVNWHWAG